jgi:hypothetical protein
LIPKKADSLIIPIAEETGYDKNLVKDIAAFYWKEVKKSMSELRSPGIYISNLGIFKCKHWDLEKFAEKYRTMVDVYKKKSETNLTLQKFSIQKEYEARLEMVENIMKMVEQDKAKQKLIKQKRNAKEIKDNLEKP